MTTPVHLLPRGTSWGEDLQIYKASKAILPWRPDQQHPVRHITRYEKSREEREYDLIQAQYRDVQREAATKDREIKARMQALADAKAKQSRYVQKFNLINHHTAEVEPVESALRPPNTRAPYNIVNHQDLDVPPVQIAPSDGLGKKMVDSQHLGRPFNVISNKYHTNHDARSQADAARLHEHAIAKFNKTHDFNPLLVRYYDSTKEMAFVEARAAKERVHGIDRDDKLPHGEQFSAGKLYNILNHEILRPEKYEAVTNVGNRRLHCMKSTQMNKAIRARAEALEDAMHERALNRIAHERNAQAYVHGFDPVTNQPFEGRLRKPKVPLRTHVKPTAWGRVDHPSRPTMSNQTLDRVLPALASPSHAAPPHGGMLSPIQPEILFISHDERVDPERAKVFASPMTKSR